MARATAQTSGGIDLPPEQPGLLDRALRVFSEVRAGESGTALLMFANLFLLLLAYYIIKTVRDTIILLEGGAEAASYAAAGQAAVLIGFVPLYSWFASRVNRMKLIVGFILFFVSNLELFQLGQWAHLPYLALVFYIWAGIFNISMVAQFWSFANDLYPKDAGERLFPIIAIGATLGGPLGAKAAQLLFEAGINPYVMAQISAALLLVHLGLYAVVHRRESRRLDQATASHEPLAAGGGFSLVLASRYLLLIAVLLIVLNVVNTTGNYIWNSSLVSAADKASAADPSLSRQAFIGSFQGRFSFYQNILVVLIQALLVSRIVKYFGMRGVLLALPFVALGAYGLIAAGAGFAAIRWAKTTENATDYSVMNTARAMLWLPTRREEKYKAKQAVDTFFVRVGDVLSAGLVFAGTHGLALEVRGFARANLVLIALWLTVAVLVLREHEALTRVARPPIPA